MKTRTTACLILLGVTFACVCHGGAADVRKVRPYPDPGYALMGGYRGPAAWVDYVTMDSPSWGDTFPNKKEWWAARKARHDAGKLSRHEILSALYGVGPGYRFEEGLTLEKIKARLDAWLKPEPGVPTYPELIPAITLGEENAGGQFLDETARYVRETYGIPVFQWWTDPWTPAPSVAADGYVWDSYGWEYPRFRKHVMKFVSLGKPVNCVVWAAHPQWSGYNLQFSTVAAMTNSVERQFQSCMEFNVPVTLFAVSGPHGSTGTWAGSGDPCMIELRNWISMKRMEMHSFQPGDLPLASANISAASRSISAGGDPGEPSVYEEDFGGFGWIEDANLMGFLDMKLTSEPEERPGSLLARTHVDRAVTATLTYRFESYFPLESVKVTVKGAAPAAARARNCVALSLDGNDWNLKTEQAGNGDIRAAELFADSSSLKDARVFFLQVKMTNDARKAGVPANRLDSLRAECIHRAPENAAATLYQDDNGKLIYQDDFLSSRWKHLGELTVAHESHGGYSAGGFWVGMKGGYSTGVHVVQRVSAPGELKELVVTADCTADGQSLGGAVVLGVSPRGEQVKWEVRTEGTHSGPLRLEVPSSDLGGLREFDVHVRLLSSSGVEGGAQACASLNGLRIEAR